MTMQVDLLYSTPDPERAVATAARSCYAKVGGEELFQEMSAERAHSVLATIMGSGHYSALEHASYTFSVEGVSRTLTHQLVRHRLASYNQQSQRYVRFDAAPEIIEPPTVTADPRAHTIFEEAMTAAYRAYAALAKLDIPTEDARYVLPNACATKIVITMNIRELLHFFELRCCHRAQWEIQELATRMLELARPTAPFIFKDAGAPCVRGHCNEGKMSCGHPYPQVQR
ncbi:MAG: FAD-dependent thymidylate synthase [Coriobacteriales bacterium]|jgi:thymidylate synthase (FAD)|nr:FAD-dependent thymidylate synthase [Coriobacteriales bacterium]